MVLYSYWLKIELFWLVCLRGLGWLLCVVEAQRGYSTKNLKTATVSRGWLVSKHSGGEHLPSNVLVTALRDNFYFTRQTLVSRQIVIFHANFGQLQMEVFTAPTLCNQFPLPAGSNLSWSWVCGLSGLIIILCFSLILVQIWAPSVLCLCVPSMLPYLMSSC